MKVELLKIFVASPGDVHVERDVVREVIEDVNRTIAQEKGVVLSVVGWETDARPSFGGDPQQVVNDQIADMSQYDLIVGILWNRFGTPTPRADSGTEEEFNRAVGEYRRRGRPEIMFYFRQTPTNLTTTEQIAQKGKVLGFKEKLRGQGLVWDYQDAEEFRRLFQKHFVMWLRESRAETPAPPPEPRPRRTEPTKPPRVGRTASVAKAAASRAVSDSGAWVLLNNAFYKSRSVSESNDGTVEILVPPANAEEEAALRSLRPETSRRVEPVYYAYKNDGFIARIVSVELRSEAGKSVWAVTLKPDRDLGANSSMEFGTYNGVTADEIAAQRARLLLLNESAPPQGQTNDRLLEAMLSNFNSDIKVTEGIFPKLWTSFKGRSQVFLPAARLWAVFMLKASGTCHEILELTLGPIDDSRLKVRLRGRRRKPYTTAEAVVVEVDGVCVLRE